MIQRLTNTYDHSLWRTRDPVRSPIDKPESAELVVGSVTTGESSVLYVFIYYPFFFFLSSLSSRRADPLPWSPRTIGLETREKLAVLPYVPYVPYRYVTESMIGGRCDSPTRT